MLIDELMEVLDEHQRRIRRLERMLEDRIYEHDVDYHRPIYSPKISDESDYDEDDYEFDDDDWSDLDSDYSNDPFDDMP